MLIISLPVSKKRQQTGLPFTTQSIQQCHRRVRQVCFIGATPSSSLAACLKTSFSRLDPIPRGQATVIKPSVRCSSLKISKQQRPRATSFLPTSDPSTTSGRLGHPWVHKDRARTSWAKPTTPGSLQINLLFTMYAEQASVKTDANFYFFKRQMPISTIQSQHQSIWWS